MIDDFLSGIRSYFEAIRYIREYKLWKYLIWPGFLSLLVAAIIIYFTQSGLGSLSEKMANWYPFQRGSGLVSSISGFVSAIGAVFTSLIFFKYTVLIVGSPFMSLLSEKVEREIAGHDTSPPFSLAHAIKDILRGIRLTMRNFFREIFLTLLLLFLSIFPGLALVTTPLIFAVQSYYAGFGSMDFYMERHYNIRGAARFVNSHRGMALANGMGFLVMLMIPFIGVFMAPGLATVAATLECVERDDKIIEDSFDQLV